MGCNQLYARTHTRVYNSFRTRLFSPSSPGESSLFLSCRRLSGSGYASGGFRISQLSRTTSWPGMKCTASTPAPQSSTSLAVSFG